MHGKRISTCASADKLRHRSESQRMGWSNTSQPSFFVASRVSPSAGHSFGSAGSALWLLFRACNTRDAARPLLTDHQPIKSAPNSRFIVGFAGSFGHLLGDV